MSEARERLIRESFELERDFFYRDFRERHWNVPEVAAACPEEEARETMLRRFWKQDAEKRYPEYRASVAGLSTAQLTAHRDELAELLAGGAAGEYREMLREASGRGVPANDNERRVDR
jgi:hypothetical protein